MKTKLKKLLSVFTAAAIALTSANFVAITGFAEQEIDPELLLEQNLVIEPVLGSAPSTQAEVISRLNSVINGEYGDGEWFPYDGNSDYGSVPASLAGGLKGGIQCFGYARYVFGQVFNAYAPDAYCSNHYELYTEEDRGKNVKLIAQVSGTNTEAKSQATLVLAKPGDFIQCNRASGYEHSMIVVSVTDTTVKLLDCNLYYDNVVHVRDESFAVFAEKNAQFSIYRYVNYPEDNTSALSHYDHEISDGSDSETTYALDLIYNQNNNTARASRTKRAMASYLLYDSQYAVFGGEDWPVTYNGDGAYSVTDNKLSAIDGTTTIRLATHSWSSMAYCWFAMGAVHSEEAELNSTTIDFSGSAGSYSASTIETTMKDDLQAGEHLRISDTWSLCFISCDDDGFYFLQYPTTDDSDKHIRMRYATYDTFTKWLNSTGKEFWYYSVDTTVNGTKAVSNLTISTVANQLYTGSAIKPAVTVKDGNNLLAKDTNYTISYSNNTNVGTASIKITGKGKYSGSKTINFTIVPPAPTPTAKAGTNKVTLSWNSIAKATNYLVYTYNGSTLLSKQTTTGTSYTVTGLTAGTKYTFKVKALVNNIWSGFSSAATATPTANIIPTNVKAAAGAGQVKVSWSAVSGATQYLVYTYNGSTLLSKNTTTSTSYTVTNLTGNTKYTFKVKSYVNSAWSGFSSAVTATPTAIPIPTNIKASASNSKVTVSWNAISGASQYLVYTYKGSTLVSKKTTTSTSYTVSGLTNGTKYTFKVKSYVNSTWSGFSSAVTATPIASAIPTNVKATTGAGQVKISWNAVDKATQYLVYTYNGSTLISKKTSTATSYTVTGLAAGTKYTFKVKAFVNDTWSGFSSAVTATPTAIPVPANVKAAAGNSKATVSWSAVSGASQYLVYTYNGSTLVSKKTTTSTTYTVSGLTNGTKYTFKVKSYVNDIWSNFSSAVNATPKA